MTQEVLKQALEALEINRVMAADADGNYTREVTPEKTTEAITALRTAISQPDCRGCENLTFPANWVTPVYRCFLPCTNGDKFVALPKVVLYKVTK